LKGTSDRVVGNALQSERLLVSEYIPDFLLSPRGFLLDKGKGKRNLAVVEDVDLFFYFVRGCDPVGA
jgi:hypothetical protein